MASVLWLQAQPVSELQTTAKSFMRQGDFANAILVLNRALQTEPGNVEMTKDLAQCFYFTKDFNKALETIRLVLDKDNADDQCYQIAGNIYRQLDMAKECEKLYRRGIKKFPESGPMYNELGELLWDQQDYTAIKQWEKGIGVDPNYSGNYYNACKFYYLTADKVWTLLYGEIYLNMEPLNSKAPEVKNMLLESYKKLFSVVNADPSKEKNKFVAAYLTGMNKQGVLANEGINVASLTMIRTRFILDWFDETGNGLSFRLFELHRQLLQEGMFEAYNQWIFGATQNLVAYQNWTNTHASEYNEFNRFQRGRIFKIPSGEYYRLP